MGMAQLRKNQTGETYRTGEMGVFRADPASPAGLSALDMP